MLATLSLSFLKVKTQNCEATNTFFNSGERISYEVFYHWGFIWVEAGSASFTTDTATYNGEKVFHLVGAGKNYPKWDWMYKINDKYESFANLNDLKPYYFKRNINEGGVKYFEEYTFNSSAQTIETRLKKDGTTKTNLVEFSPCTYDPISLVYYARCIDFSTYSEDDKIPLNMIIDGEVYETYLRYQGKETIEVKNQGKYKTLKFSALLIEGSLFKGGEGMTVWVSDDKNKIPVQIESEILVGSVNIALTNAEGLKHPVTSKID